MGLPNRAEDSPGCPHLDPLVRQAGASEQDGTSTIPPGLAGLHGLLLYTAPSRPGFCLPARAALLLLSPW